jgi:hypothetical protein
MSGRDLFYLSLSEEIIHSEQVPFEELFLRKLVDATMVRNQLWQHERHEHNDEHQSAIYVTAWDGVEISVYRDAIRHVLFDRYDVSNYYEVQWYKWQVDQQSFELWKAESTDHPLTSATVLLDHAYQFHQQRFVVLYAVLDLDRRKLLLFLREEE